MVNAFDLFNLENFHLLKFSGTEFPGKNSE